MRGQVVPDALCALEANSASKGIPLVPVFSMHDHSPRRLLIWPSTRAARGLEGGVGARPSGASRQGLSFLGLVGTDSVDELIHLVIQGSQRTVVCHELSRGAPLQDQRVHGVHSSAGTHKGIVGVVAELA